MRVVWLSVSARDQLTNCQFTFGRCHVRTTFQFCLIHTLSRVCFLFCPQTSSSVIWVIHAHARLITSFFFLFKFDRVFGHQLIDLCINFGKVTSAGLLFCTSSGTCSSNFFLLFRRRFHCAHCSHASDAADGVGRYSIITCAPASLFLISSFWFFPNILDILEPQINSISYL